MVTPLEGLGVLLRWARPLLAIIFGCLSLEQLLLQLFDFGVLGIDLFEQFLDDVVVLFEGHGLSLGPNLNLCLSGPIKLAACHRVHFNYLLLTPQL